MNWTTKPPSLGGASKKGSLDAFIHLKDSSGVHWKLYIEFKNFQETLTDKKDIEYQPFAIQHNNFNTSRYKHDVGEQWLYISITKDTPYSRITPSFPSSNYLNFKWSDFFEEWMNKVYPLAISSNDKGLLHFINFLFNK